MKLASLGEGIQTCFLRAHQSYTTKIFNQNDPAYLNSSYFTMTEECFAEALGTTKANFSDLGKNLIRSLNSLSAETHSFHQKVLKSQESGDKLSQLFSKIESLRDETLDDIEALAEGYEEDIQAQKKGFMILALLFPLIVLWEIAERKKHQMRVTEVENVALEHLQDGHPRLDSQVEGIFKRAFELGTFANCAKLFDVWNQNRGVVVNKKMATLTPPPVTLVAREDFEEDSFVDPMAEDTNPVEVNSFEQAVSASELITSLEAPIPRIPDGMPMETLIARVIDNLSTRIFSAGVTVDLDVQENIYIEEREETVEQVIYQAVNRSLNALTYVEGKRQLRLTAKKVGDTFFLEIMDNGEIFSVNTLDAQVGLATEDFNLELSICRELVKELKGEMILENVLHENMAIGGKMKIRFDMAHTVLSDVNKRLVSLKKGKKKHLMQHLQEMQ